MKTLLLFILAGVVSFSAAAQRDNNLKIGGRLGLNVATLSDDPSVIDSNAGIGPEFGLFFRLGERLYVQPGVEYVSHSVHPVRVVQPRPGERDEFTTRFLRAPVLVGIRNERSAYRTSFISHTRFFAGPSFAYAFSVKDNNIDIRRRDITNAHFALNGGVGIDIASVIGIDVMYHHGFTNVFNDSGAEGKYRNFSLSLSVAL